MDAVISKDKKQCPFCGNAVEVKFMVFSDSCCTIGGDNRIYYVVCSCGVTGPHSDTREGAVERWNRRK